MDNGDVLTMMAQPFCEARCRFEFRAAYNLPYGTSRFVRHNPFLSALTFRPRRFLQTALFEMTWYILQGCTIQWYCGPISKPSSKRTDTRTRTSIFCRIVYPPPYFAKFLFSEIMDQRITIRLRQYRRRHRFKLFRTPAAARL